MSWASRCTERCHEAEGGLRDVMGLEMSLREGARLTRVCATHTALYSGAQPSACACGVTWASRKKGLAPAQAREMATLAATLALGLNANGRGDMPMPSACCAVLSSVDRDVWMPIMPSADVLDAKYARSSVERDVWMPSMPGALSKGMSKGMSGCQVCQGLCRKGCRKGCLDAKYAKC